MPHKMLVLCNSEISVRKKMLRENPGGKCTFSHRIQALI